MSKDQQNKPLPFIFYLIIIFLLLLVSFAFWNAQGPEPTQSLQLLESSAQNAGSEQAVTFRMNPEAKDFRVYFFKTIKNKP